MNLLTQLSLESLQCLIDEQPLKSDSSVQFCAQACPPPHVLQRSIQLAQAGTATKWALPYFICMEKTICIERTICIEKTICIEQTVVGSIGFKQAPQHRQVEIGYNVAPSMQGRGLATLAVKELAQIAFSAPLIDQVYAQISPHNHASLSVVKKCGFVYQHNVVDDDGECLQRWVLSRPA